MKRVLDAFEEACINVRGYSAADTGDYGIVRFILDKPDEALAVLKGLGSAATMTEVLCVKLMDKPGELAHLMGAIAEAGINVTYSYSLISTYIALKVDDTEEAERALAARGIELADQGELA
jgi:hypothetical protein